MPLSTLVVLTVPSVVVVLGFEVTIVDTLGMMFNVCMVLLRVSIFDPEVMFPMSFVFDDIKSAMSV